MPPDNPQNQQGPQASLPPISADQPLQQASPVSQGEPQRPIAPERTAEHYAMQAKQLALQYANDPYRLSEALGQLKAAYLAEQYHITSNHAGN